MLCADPDVEGGVKTGFNGETAEANGAEEEDAENLLSVSYRRPASPEKITNNSAIRKTLLEWIGDSESPKVKSSTVW